MGAAYLAGLAVGFWKSAEDLDGHWKPERVFEPQMSLSERERLKATWRQAVTRSKGWIAPRQTM
jgi:glycerol kinase